MLAALLARVRSYFLPRSRELDPNERRQLVRVRCSLPVQIRPRDATLNGRILDMGLQGIRVRFTARLKVGQIVELRASMAGQERQAWVKFQVRWVRTLKDGRGYSYGMCYAQPPEAIVGSWVSLLIRELGLDDKRIHERREFIRAEGKIPILLLYPSIHEKAPIVEMVNLAVGGVLVRSRLPLDVGRRVKVRLGPLPSLPVRGAQVLDLLAEVRSSHPDEVGTASLSGLRFLNLEAGEVRALGQYVLSLLEANHGS